MPAFIIMQEITSPPIIHGGFYIFLGAYDNDLADINH